MNSETYQVTVADLGYYGNEKQIDILVNQYDEPYGFLSNWYLSEFTVDGASFSSMEQYMMYKKAVLFEDTDIAAQIMDTDDVVAIKEFGRRVSGYNDSVWNGQNLLGYSLMLVRDELRK
ncbi:MAG: NADAR family protein [Saccharofermentans sp.]|nr:NADAR family protein [Saccharofermentans sp.]